MASDDDGLLVVAKHLGCSHPNFFGSVRREESGDFLLPSLPHRYNLYIQAREGNFPKVALCIWRKLLGNLRVRKTSTPMRKHFLAKMSQFLADFCSTKSLKSSPIFEKTCNTIHQSKAGTKSFRLMYSVTGFLISCCFCGPPFGSSQAQEFST